MTDQIQILLCPFCGCTDVLADIDTTANLDILACEKCKDGDETEPAFDDEDHAGLTCAWYDGFKRGAKAAVPEGWQVVPKKPTSTMTQATYSLILRSPETIYTVMLEAAPSPEGE
jgi:hypothetical protein